jgi:hypothetical protein
MLLLVNSKGDDYGIGLRSYGGIQW